MARSSKKYRVYWPRPKKVRSEDHMVRVGEDTWRLLLVARGLVVQLLDAHGRQDTPDTSVYLSVNEVINFALCDFLRRCGMDPQKESQP